MKTTLLWLAGLIFSIWFFYFAIPVNIQVRHYVMVSIPASFIIAICSVALFVSIYNNFFKNDKEKEPEDYVGYLIFGVFMVAFFGTGISFISREVGLEEKEYREYGVFTTGKVVDGTIMKTRKADLSSITIQYFTKEGVEHIVNNDISSSELNQYGISQEVPIVYSRRYPEMYKIIRNTDEIVFYTKKVQKDLELKDLIFVLNSKEAEIAKNYLNDKNEKWTAKAGEEPNTVVYENEIKKMIIKTKGEEDLTFVSEQNITTSFEKELSANKDFTKLNLAELKGNTYQNNEFIVNIKSENPYSYAFDTNEGIVDKPGNISVVSVLKKKR